MKRIGYLFDKMLDKEFIKNTIILASKHKTSRREVKRVLAKLDTYVDKIYQMLVTNKIELKPTNQLTITLSTTDYNKLTADDIAIATNKNWQIVTQ